MSEHIIIEGGPPHVAYSRLGSGMVLIVMGPDEEMTKAASKAATVAAWEAMPAHQRPTDPSWVMPDGPIVATRRQP
jgi:hypothetical protein